jgi:hypothetical protein
VRKAILFLFTLTFLDAQEVLLRVLVKDASGAPVPKAHVALLQHREKKLPTSQGMDTPTVDAMALTNERGEAILRCAT